MKNGLDFFQSRWFPLLVVAALLIGGVCGGAELLTWPMLQNDPAAAAMAQFRLVRMLTALIVGSALGLSGATFQVILRNPLAEPFTLGLSSGAGVGAVLAFLLGLRAVTPYAVPLMALAGAVTVLLLVLLLSRGGARGPESLLLSGVIAGTLLAALLIYLVSIADRDDLAGMTWWLLGDLGSGDPVLLIVAGGVLAAGYVLLRGSAGALNALAVGAETAWDLGFAPRRMTVLFSITAAALAAVTVALAGVIGFAGLAVPHFVRRCYGCDHRRILPLLGLWGAAFLMGCDLLSRMIFTERELPIGVATAWIGGPLLLYLLNCGRGKRC